jgi:hypothetical protein
MKKHWHALIITALIFSAIHVTSSSPYAGQSTITVVDGNACMGEDKSRKQTENEALTNVKRKAVEYASTYLKSETRVKDFQIEKDLVDAYANATIKIIEEVEKAWYKDPASGDCFKLKIKAEVIPDDKAMAQIAKDKSVVDDPNAPLNVQLWTDKKEYRQSEKIKVYLKGNKPFYARVLHKDVKGALLQILPNAYRTDNYFNGGVVYEIPSGNDRFDLEVNPPFGEENIIVYSSLAPLGDINLKETGGVYQVKTAANDVGVRTRGIKLKEREEGKEPTASEFFEVKVIVYTGK